MGEFSWCAFLLVWDELWRCWFSSEIWVDFCGLISFFLLGGFSFWPKMGIEISFWV
jgi:hypothetical protein